MNDLSYIYSQSDPDVSVCDSAFYFLNKRKQKNIDKLMLVLFFKYKKNNIDKILIIMNIILRPQLFP